MPEDMDDKPDLHSSEQVTDDTSTDQVDVAASSAADDETPADTLSVVRDVVEKAKEETASSADDKEPGAEKAEGTEEGDPDEAEPPDPRLDKHPRFRKLLKKTKDLEAKVAEFEGKVTEYEPDATRYRNIEGYLRQNNLTAEEAADGLEIMALAKLKPAEALERLKPFVQKLLVASGEVLPEDLQGKVKSGALPVDAAREVSRARAQVAQQEAAQRILDEQRQREATTQHQQSLRTTATDWLADRDRKDPAFQQKYPLMQREVAFLQRNEGIPKTVEGVRDQLQRAYDAVNKQARTVAPAPGQRPAVRPVTGGTATGNISPQPNSTLDVIRQTLASR